MLRNQSGFDPYSVSTEVFAADAHLSERLGFLRRVYMNVFGAIALLTALEFVYFKTGFGITVLRMMGDVWWLMILGFMAVSMIAQRMAASNSSTAVQYLGLGLYVGLQSVFLSPIIGLAAITKPDLIGQAAFLTILITGALSLFIVLTKSDFSFLGNILFVGGIALMGISIASAIWGFGLGIVFSGAVIALMCGYILYQTSIIMHHLPTNAHVAGALMIFASVSTLFREILFLLMRMNRD